MIKQWKRYFMQEDEGVGTVEIILILVVLIALVVIFREQIIALVDSIFANINSAVNGVY